MAVRKGGAVNRWGRGGRIVVLAASWIALAIHGSAAEAGKTIHVRHHDLHGDWDDLLRRHVRGDRIDYDGFQRDGSQLRRYLDSLRDLGLPSQEDEIALWINAYNAATIDLIVRERLARGGRLRSIKDIPSAWSRPRWRIAGAERSLDEIEHEILRGRFREPRIHFALVCASRSCPALRPSAYRGAFLDAQLDSAARAFVRDPSRNRFDPADGSIRISKIFEWYAKDFVGLARDETLERMYGRERGAMVAYAARYLDGPTAARLRSSKVRVTFSPYDWSLNSAGNAE
ncbi:MAG TPA: DUF547 domain-containing protein [Candidatus Eisenbacteria bacterium]|nr:DUF547 domain-containing protein [Candidatus Eisenbacteria bacterium]